MPTKAELVAKALGDREVVEGVRDTDGKLEALLNLPSKLEPLLNPKAPDNPIPSTSEAPTLESVGRDVKEVARAHNALIEKLSKEGGDNGQGAKGAIEATDTKPSAEATDGIDQPPDKPPDQPPESKPTPKWGYKPS